MEDTLSYLGLYTSWVGTKGGTVYSTNGARTLPSASRQQVVSVNAKEKIPRHSSIGHYSFINWWY